jgi:AAA+ superfamily predicted ATPase
MFNFLKQLISERLRHHFGQEKDEEILNLPPPLLDEATAFGKFVHFNNINREELILLLMSLVPHLYPGFFERIISEQLPNGGDFPEFGGAKSATYRGFLPTGETVLFVLAGTNWAKRADMMYLFSSEHWLVKEKILTLESVAAAEPRLSGRLVLDAEYVELFTTGNVSLPNLTMRFPAEHLTTQLEWNDLVLSEQTMAQVRELESWVKHNPTLLYEWGMIRQLKAGYRVLFTGPPGTGKTMTATLIGKATNLTVFRIDLSMVVSKYIGETEKNLSTLFEKARHKNWILFFDEADALFGKRTNVRDAHDKYANQEVSFLLQQIENYPGLTILATNFKSNIDEAFTRRFHSIIEFSLPKAPERLILWQKAFPPQLALAEDINLTQIAQKYELNGAEIMNIVQYCCIITLTEGKNTLTLDNLLRGIKREYLKEGRMLK